MWAKSGSALFSRKWAIASRTLAGLASPTPQKWADQCSPISSPKKETFAKGRPPERGKDNRDFVKATKSIALVMLMCFRNAMSDILKTCFSPRLGRSNPPYSNCCQGVLKSLGIEALPLLLLRKERRPPPAQDCAVAAEGGIIPTPWVRNFDAAAPGGNPPPQPEP